MIIGVSLNEWAHFKAHGLGYVLIGSARLGMDYRYRKYRKIPLPFCIPFPCEYRYRYRFFYGNGIYGIYGNGTVTVIHP
jgi:hypothetical protein